MKTVSLLGALFLPGTYLTAVFSTSFFDFQNQSSLTISKQFWIYSAFTIPITGTIVEIWLMREWKADLRYERENLALEKEMGEFGDLESRVRTRENFEMARMQQGASDSGTWEMKEE
jgi:hypothetical protein